MAERSKAPDSSLKGFPLRSILVHECGRGFESHFWQRFSISREQILYNLQWLNMTWVLCAPLPSTTNECICVTKWPARRCLIAHLTSKWNDFSPQFGNQWRTGVSIPVPLECESSALPLELDPRTNLANLFCLYLATLLFRSNRSRIKSLVHHGN